MATLEQLDAYGTLEQLDAYGTLEQLDALQPLLASGTGGIGFTTTANATLRKWIATVEQLDGWGSVEDLDAYAATVEELNFLVVHEASAADSITLTESATAIRVPTVSASDTMSLTTDATANFLVSVSGTGDIAITETAGIDRFRTVNASNNIQLTQFSRANRILSASLSDAELTITGDVDLFRIQPISAIANISVSTSLLPEILGEEWTDVSGTNVIWSIAS
jgi:hypothetical protein